MVDIIIDVINVDMSLESGIHCFNLARVAVVDYGAANLEGVSEFSGLHCEFLRKEGEFLYLLEAGEVGL